MSRVASFALLVVLLLGGCFGPSADDQADGPREDEVRHDVPTTPALPTSPDVATASAPRWQPGDWWRWEVDGRDAEPFELTTVVGRTTDGGYHIGAVELDQSLRAQILHVPPQGPVAVPGMAWYAHGHDTSLVDFPLFEGKTWTGSFEGRPLMFTADLAERDGRDVFEVNTTYTDFEGQGPRYVWDPAMEMFSEIHLHYGGSRPFSSARVVESGTGYEGEVRLPTIQDKFLDGTGGPTALLQPAAGFTAPADKVWLVFACYLGGDTGSYGITYVTPSPNEDPLRCALQNDQPDFVNDVQVMWRSSVPGDWNILFDVVGNGYAEAEVIGVFDEVCRLGAGDSGSAGC